MPERQQEKKKTAKKQRQRKGTGVLRVRHKAAMGDKRARQARAWSRMTDADRRLSKGLLLGKSKPLPKRTPEQERRHRLAWAGKLAVALRLQGPEVATC